VHGHGVERAEAGSRTAVNLQGLEKAAIERGMVLAPPDTLHPSRRMDLKVQYLSGNEKPLKNRTQVRFHTGSSETLGRLLLLDAEELAPGQSGMAQVLLESDAVALGGDRFVLRSYSPVRTIGGGEILNPAAPRHKRFNPNTLAELEALAAKDPVESIRILIQSAGASGVSATQLAGLIDLPAGKIKSALEQLLSRQEAVTFDKERGRVLSRTTVDQLSEAVLGILADFHQRYPLRPGLVKEELKTRVPGLAESRVLAFILDRLAKSGRAVIERDVVRLAEHQVSLAGDFEAIENKLTEVIAAAGAMPPYFKDVSAQLPGGPQQHKEVLDHLVKKGRLVKVKTDLYYDRAVLDELWSKARDILKTQGELTTPGFKDAVGLSRKYLIPILEHFDARGLTMRIGDKRVLRSEG
jgi:selenocysteine-specific elongation factor